MKTSKQVRTVAVVVMALGLAACGGIQHARHARGGVVRITGSLVDGTSSAHVAMTDHCGGRWRLVTASAASEATGDAKAPSAAPIAAESAHVTSDRVLAYECASRR